METEGKQMVNAKKNYRLLNIVDGGSLTDLARKGNLAYVETLYNPSNFFETVYHIVFRKQDLSVRLINKSIRLRLLRRTRYIPKVDFLVNLVYYVYQMVQDSRKWRVDIIRARGPFLAGILSILVGSIARIPVVVSIGGDNRLAQSLEGKYFLNNRLISYKVEEFVLKHADKVFCPNKFSRWYVKSLGIRDDRAIVMPLLLPDQVFHPKGDAYKIRGELGWPNQPIVLAVSRLNPYKQVDVLIEAIPAILRKIPDAKFLFIGDGPIRPSLQARCKQLNVEGSVRFTGFQPARKLGHYFAASTLIWIPMSGFVVYEAAAARKPIIAFDVEWHSEFIENGVTGVLVKNRDIVALAEAVVRLLKDPLRAKELGRKARERLDRLYQPRVTVNTEIGAYKSILEEYR